MDGNTTFIIGHRTYYYRAVGVSAQAIFVRLSILFAVVYFLAMGLEDPADVDAAPPKSMQAVGTKRSNWDVLCPWELLPSKSLHPGKRSKLDSATSYEQL